MPELLHSQTGLRIHRNDRNRFVVCELHYTADPAKRSEQWKREARTGMPPALWAQEYELDWFALFGAKVFPEIHDKREAILVPETIELPENAPCWGGFDFGQRNPSSFHVYVLDDGMLYSVWELYEPCASIPEFAKKLKDCPYWPRLRYVAADPDLWSNKMVNKQGAPCSVADLFIEAGIYKFIKGNTDEASWVATMRAHWSTDPPTFRISRLCPQQIQEFESAIYSTMTEHAIATTNYKESIANHNNHALDDCKYLMNTKPHAPRRTKSLPKLVSKFAMRWAQERRPSAQRYNGR